MKINKIKDIKRLQKRSKDMKKLKLVIDKLLNNQKLEPKYYELLIINSHH